MYIESIIIEGFKSYAQRTVITGFHEHFNAITGLNGSGKSNVLDAICFVLGIANLSQVRAQDFQDLIYKKGQAGITKASVQLIFNNEDKKNSPALYDGMDKIIVMREIQVGSGNKYKINGKRAEAKNVQHLFRSVQLNVNNPTFLIMQGRVTKVLNMKPPEILAMVEETAGTKMYESSKNNSLKLIEKKEKKVAEIEEVLDNEIGPKMRQLNEERSTYLTFQKNQQELDKLERIVIAHKLYTQKEFVKSASLEMQEMGDKMSACKVRGEELNMTIKDLEFNIETLRRKREQEMGGGLRDLEKEVQNVSKELVTATTIHKNSAESHAAEVENKTRLNADIEEMIATLATRRKELEKEEAALKQLQDAHAALAEELEKAQQGLLGAQAGMAGGANTCKSFADQLRDAENEASVAATEVQQADMKLKHATAEFKKKKPLAAEAEKAHAKVNHERAKKQKDLDEAQQQLDASEYDEKVHQAVAKEHAAVGEKKRSVQEQVDMLQARMANLQFEYSDPEPNFNRSKIHGLVARLIRVADPAHSTALEVAAGGKLYNVVVDTQETGGKLLKNGKLRQRVTIIPLNKIAARTLSPEVLAKAQQQVGRDNAQLALSLVGYSDEVEKAMQYVFGGTIVCKDPESAQAVTFNQAVRARSVTLEGDVYEPSGTLSGGSRSSKVSVLQQLQALREVEDELVALQTLHKTLSEQCTDLKRKQEVYNTLTQLYELRKHDIDLLDERIRSSTHGQQLLELKALEDSMVQQAELKKGAQQKEKAAKERVAEIVTESKEFANNAEAELKRMEKQIAQLKKRVAASSQDMKNKHQEVERTKLEMEDLEKDMRGAREQLTQMNAAIAKLCEQEAAHAAKAEEVRATFDERKAKLEKKKAKLEETDSEINAMQKTKRGAAKEKDDAELASKKLANQKTRLEKELKDANESLSAMYDKHKWVKGAEDSFGVPGTAFDFGKEDVAEYSDRVDKLKEQQKKLQNQVNMKALSMMEDIKREHDELLKKKVIVEKDKCKILQSIEELDKKKAEALEKTHAQVNKDFGNIFSTLLPGTQAKLEPPPGMTVQEGLEVKVAFGTTWKDSLTELSGGQRSLIALSLILSLLRFKPAPMYILDEIDAALDLSHTQNIGKMLRMHFAQSQFIVVSLKEGMFNNANVLFRVRFVDGTSTVTRYAQEQLENTEAAAAGKRTQKAVTGKPLASRNRA